MNPAVVFFFGFLAGVALMLAVLQLCIWDIRRRLRKIMRDGEEFRKGLGKPR
jgi:hypothetical protein